MQQRIHQRRLSVINMGDNGDIPQVFAALHHSLFMVSG
jgi:hypothetical protein